MFLVKTIKVFKGHGVTVVEGVEREDKEPFVSTLK